MSNSPPIDKGNPEIAFTIPVFKSDKVCSERVARKNFLLLLNVHCTKFYGQKNCVVINQAGLVKPLLLMMRCFALCHVRRVVACFFRIILWCEKLSRRLPKLGVRRLCRFRILWTYNYLPNWPWMAGHVHCCVESQAFYSEIELTISSCKSSVLNSHFGVHTSLRSTSMRAMLSAVPNL